MFDLGKFFCRHQHPRKHELGLILFAIGVGILLVVILPVWGWMLGCAFCLIAIGLLVWKDC